MNFSSAKLLAALANRVRASEVHTPDKTETRFNKLLYDVSKAYFDIAAKTARTTGHKTIAENHVKLMSDVASRMRGGAETVLPSEYFGKDSGQYESDASLTSSEALPAGLVRTGLTYSATGGACPCAARGTGMLGGGVKKLSAKSCAKKAAKSSAKSSAKKPSKKKSLVGGAETVLPTAEYFSGKDSGQYYAHDVIMASDVPQDLVRQELESTFPSTTLTGGGGATSGSSNSTITTKLPDDVFGKVWQEYKLRTGSARDLRMSSGARMLLRNVIGATVAGAVKHAHVKKHTRALTPSCIDYAIKHYTMFP